MPACDAERSPDGHEQDAVLALNHDKSGSSAKPPECPTPRVDRAYLIPDTGEMVPIPCGRNSCPHCRPRNVQITASMMGLNAIRTDSPPTAAVLSTTREWVDDAILREGWAQFARRVRREVEPATRYAWFREWTTGKRDGIRRTHYHSIWSHLDDDQAQAVAEISREVWARLAGAYSEKAHGAKRVWDAGGLARYIAGLAGHHLKSEQAPPPGWSGRRFGTSRGFYAIDVRELRKEATAAVRDERLQHHLERMLADELPGPAELPSEIWDEALTAALEVARSRPKPTVVRVPKGWSW